MDQERLDSKMEKREEKKNQEETDMKTETEATYLQGCGPRNYTRWFPPGRVQRHATRVVARLHR